jgi:hypothetical protein
MRIVPYLVDFDRQITPLPLSLSKSRWANWLAARATRQGRVGTTAQLRWRARALTRWDYMFSVIDAALLRPLPYTAPDRLIELTSVEGTGQPVPMGAVEFFQLEGASQ